MTDPTLAEQIAAIKLVLIGPIFWKTRDALNATVAMLRHMQAAEQVSSDPEQAIEQARKALQAAECVYRDALRTEASAHAFRKAARLRVEMNRPNRKP